MTSPPGSLIIRGPIFTGERIETTAIRIEDGVVVAVSDQDLGRAARTIELGPRETLVPAGTDALCAMRDWGETPRDTVETVSRAALAGGVTLVCDQANTVPRIDTPEIARDRGNWIAPRSFTDFAVHAHPPKQPERITEYKDAGVHALQLFEWDKCPWDAPRNEFDGSADYRRYAELGFSAFFWPEEEALQTTPRHAEAERIALGPLLGRFNPDLKARVLVTQPESVKTIIAAKKALPKLRVQVAPHALFVSKQRGFEKIGLGATQTPPLRSEEEVERMEALAREGLIDIVCSHHAPHRMADKYSTDPVPDEFTPKCGYSAIDFFYPLLMTRLGIPLACRLAAEAPAVHFELKRGRIATGYEAHLAVVEEDPRIPRVQTHEAGFVDPGTWYVEPLNFQSLGKVTPFVGDRLKYRVVKTFLRGEQVYDAKTGEFTRTTVRQIR
jgi:dihydroorotase-like cyclic amidohydrolase